MICGRRSTVGRAGAEGRVCKKGVCTYNFFLDC